MTRLCILGLDKTIAKKYDFFQFAQPLRFFLLTILFKIQQNVINKLEAERRSTIFILFKIL